ncbi:VWA domain-containing protein [Candidatus Viridilinea mediisalina]|uniref:CoxE n=1 Tax=Candidatus Viridilinea mediisalina TaxID=2024553 RepID=A0A2A6RNM6_9CHLR|nr:VWA domain-containing protein [Candidatus Viridilinea mediisalina]PDW04491.1 CoxE [Candidatus Viridilinea mediisalina]
MDRRITEFVAALRASGVRVSPAEAADAMRAIEQAGVVERRFFALAMQTSLIKDVKDHATFQELFPLYFGKETPPPLLPPAGGQLSNAQLQQLMQQMEQQVAQLSTELACLWRAMLLGQALTQRDLDRIMGSILPPHVSNPRYRDWMARQALRELNFRQLERALRELLAQLREQGVDEQTLQALAEAARANQAALAAQIAQAVGEQMAEQAREEGHARMRSRSEGALLDLPFDRIDERDLEDLRKIVARLVARLRTRLALRQRRGRTGTLDAKTTIRTNQRFGGIPMVLRHRKRHLKPKLVIFCDRSVSTQQVMSFMLLLIYSLHDQLSRTRSFAFIDHLYDISIYFNEARPEVAINQILEQIHPTRSYSTDLGQALREFCRDHLSCVDQRTTVIVLGDGRNNDNDPGLAAFEQIRARARRVVWFATEERWKWGVYDPGSLSSDIYAYAPLCDAMHEVTTLRQLADAIDGLFVRA